MTQTLLSDIGGTNIRFGLLEKGKFHRLILYPHEKGLSMEKAVRRYLTETKAKPDMFVAGAAGVLEKQGVIHLTNRRFKVDMPALCRKFGFQIGVLSNDMTFHALSQIQLPDTKRACVVFVGTGIGVAYIHDKVVIPSEDGHLPLARPSAAEKAIQAKSWEDVISGPAFLKIYRSLKGDLRPVLQSREVSFLAHQTRDPQAIQTYQIIAKCMAKFCIHIARRKKVSSFFLGGQAVEILRLPIGQETFFQALGKWADVLGIRIMRPGEPTAMQGLSLIAEEVRKTGKTAHVKAGAIAVCHLPDCEKAGPSKKKK